MKGHSILQSLEEIQQIAKEDGKIRLGKIFEILSEKGDALLIIIFSLPFCTPIQIPGFSTPFGILLSFIGLRMIFKKNLWWPKKLLQKEISEESIEKLIAKTKKVFHWLEKFIHPRLSFLTNHSFFQRMNGFLILCLGILLSLPLPIPMTNLLSALPILCLGIGILEEDGLMAIIGYIIAILCFSGFLMLIIMGKKYYPF